MEISVHVVVGDCSKLRFMVSGCGGGEEGGWW